MFFKRHGLDAGKSRRVVPAEVRVSLYHARHECGASAVDDRSARGRYGRRAATDLADAVAFDQHAAAVRQDAGSFEDVDIGKEGRCHGVLLSSSGSH